MRRPRARIGAELVPLVLVLAALAGSLGLIVAVHRRSATRKATAPPAVVAAAPLVAEPPAPRPIPAAPHEPEPEPEPEPAPPMSPPPPSEDPTPKALAPLRAAEAEQREEAARADRRAEALEKARKDAEAESDRWKRREALVRGQLDALDAKAQTLERQMAAMAAERDVLARRRDAAKIAQEQARARPSSAILPHKGANGTWRRPIAVECRNGMAILQPKGTAFGLLDLSEGYGPSSNPFVAAILREAVHLQGEKGPDGSPIVPYIFFVIRPDGIRPYYEARTRLEPLSITFGYELVDQETEVDFPDLDDVSTWDGSAPSRKATGPLAQAGPAAGSGPDDDLATWPAPRRGTSRGSQNGSGDRAGEFTWSMPQLGRFGATGGGPGPAGGDGGGSSRTTPGGLGGHLPGLGPIEPPGDPTGEAPDELAGVLGGPGIGEPGAHDPAGRSGLPAVEPPRGPASSPGLDGPPGREEGTPTNKPAGALAGAHGEKGAKAGEPDPGVAFVWPNRPGAGRRGEESRSSEPREVEHEAETEAAVSSIPSLPSAREISDRRNGTVRPGISGMPVTRSGRGPAPPSLPGSGEGGRPERRMNGPEGSGSGSVAGVGPNSPPPAVGTPAGIGIGLPAIGPAGGQGQGSAGSPSPSGFVSPGTIVDRTFELVVACGPRGATIQPGGYRVTADALNAPDGLLLRQMKGVVKERRGDDPHLRLEPKVRFLVQPGGEATYRAAKGQVMMSGLGWPTTFQVVGPDPVSLLPSESW